MTLDRVVVLNDTAAVTGGTAVLARASVKQISERGIAVTYFCGDDGGIVDGAETVVSLGLSALLDLPRAQALRQGFFNARVRVALAGWIAENDTPGTLYHLHAWSQILSPAVFAALRRVAPRVVVHCHDFFVVCPNGVFMDFGKGVACERRPLGLSCLAAGCDKRSRLQKAWRVARHIRMRQVFDQSLPWGAVAVAHPAMLPLLRSGGIPAERLQVLRNPAVAFCETRVRAEENTDLLYVGRVEHEKGVGSLARAARQAGVRLSVIGEGSAREELARGFPETAFLGWRDPKAIGKIARGFRALAMPSQMRETFGLVAAEASASGLPVIASELALTARDIARQGLGWSYRPDDETDLVKVIAAMKETPADEIRRISERGYSGKHALALSPAQWGEAMLALYEKLLRGRAV